MLDVLGVIAPVFLCAGVGWGWIKSGRAYDRELVTRLITDVGAPCLVFSGLVALDVGSDELATVAGAAVLALAGFALVGTAVLRAAGLPQHTFLAPLVFGNTGNMGLPLSLFAFGETGLALAVCFFATVSITHYTLGIWLWSGRVSFGELLRTPLFWAAVLAAAVLAGGVALPRWLRNTTELLGGLTIPLMLVTMGVSLAELGVSNLPRTAALSVLRLGLGAGVGFAVAWALELEGVVRGVVILECAMPVAVFNYLFAERYGRSPQAVASLVVFSTLLAFVLLPFLLQLIL